MYVLIGFPNSRFCSKMPILYVKLGPSEKTTKFKKIFHLKFDNTQQRQILSVRFFSILCSSQIVPTLPNIGLSTLFLHHMFNLTKSLAPRSIHFICNWNRQLTPNLSLLPNLDTRTNLVVASLSVYVALNVLTKNKQMRHS